MLRPEVVNYLRQNLHKYPAETLRRQLAEEGVADQDFSDSLTEALRAPKALTTRMESKPLSTAAKLSIVGGLTLIAAAAIFVLARVFLPPPPAAPPASNSGESSYVDPQGWVVRLPKGYVGVAKFADDARTDEIVHFCPSGTDPTLFIDKGLFGEMGIVRLEVAPSEFPPNATGAAQLAEAAARKTTERGEKFIMKNIQVGTLSGVQINVQSPFPRVEAYILGQSNVYFFYGGQDGVIWRAIVLSLRDTQSEN